MASRAADKSWGGRSFPCLIKGREEVSLLIDQFKCTVRSETRARSIYMCILLFILLQEVRGLSSFSRLAGYSQPMLAATTDFNAMGAQP